MPDDAAAATERLILYLTAQLELNQVRLFDAHLSLSLSLSLS
jgi:hypothetical protein